MDAQPVAPIILAKEGECGGNGERCLLVYAVNVDAYVCRQCGKQFPVTDEVVQ
jgi:hypothetical protein